MHALRLVALLLLSSAAFAGGSAKVELGRRLFMDPTVSRGARFSCASCHSPEHGFSDPRVLSEDENGKTARHSQPLLDLKDGVGMHWDGEFFTVRELLVARLASTAEARAQAVDLAARHFAAARGRGDADEKAFESRLGTLRPPSWIASGPATVTLAAPLARRLEEEGRYASGFRAAFGSPRVTSDRLVDAMEAYVLSLRSGAGAYDRHVAGDKDALSPAAKRGLALFEGKAGCASCHSGDRFTDDLFHNTGVAFLHPEGVDRGRNDRSFVAADYARFKTPSLRDVASRAPYMHDGTFRTLRDVVRYYDRGGTKNAALDPHIRRLDLEEGEIDDLVAFLESLTSDERPGLGRAGQRRETRVRIEGLDGNPMKGLPVRIEPFGDRLSGAGKEGASGADGAITCTTDHGGWISFRFPDWTHVRVLARGLSIGEGQPLPDTLRETKLIAAPANVTAVRIKGPALPEKLVASNAAFTKVRTLRPGEAIYVSDHTRAGGAVVTFLDLPKGAVSRNYAIEFARGFTEAIDLRPDPDVLTPPTTGTVSVTPTAAAGSGARENVGSDRAAARRDR